MNAQAHFVAVDWGTSSFRLWVCDKAGVSLAGHQSDRGMSRLQPGHFAPYLDSILSELEVSRDVPVIICGMAGARAGWCEAPYVATPADARCHLSRVPEQ
jgi:2-dehydro-3-deoxygalactonokinase